MSSNEGPLGPHDVASLDLGGRVDTKEHPMQLWELNQDAATNLCFRKGLFNVHEFRRGIGSRVSLNEQGIEAIPAKAYADFTHYGRWGATTWNNLVQKGHLKEEDVYEFLGKPEETANIKFAVRADLTRV